MGKRIRGQPKGVEVVDPELVRQRELEALRKELERAKRRKADAVKFHMQVEPVLKELKYDSGWPVEICKREPRDHHMRLLDQAEIKTDFGLLIRVWYQEGRIHVQLRYGKYGGAIEHHSYTELDEAMDKIREFKREVSSRGRWVVKYELRHAGFEERIFWKEARLAGADVVPGYALMFTKARGKLISVQFERTRFSALWHVKVMDHDGTPWSSFSYETQEEALEQASKF